MKAGDLSRYFRGVALKRLSEVETDSTRSHQHEFNGVERLRSILGEPHGKVHFAARFLYLADDSEEALTEDSSLTWYDAREKARLERGIQRQEYRLYFPSNSISHRARAGDLLLIARKPDNSLLAIVTPQGSTAERQLLWLFGVPDLSLPGFCVPSTLDGQDRTGFATRFILAQIGIEAQDSAPDHLEQTLARFGHAFPGTAEFSAWARSTLPHVSGRDDPDAALLAWMEREEVLFRALEKHLLVQQLRDLTASGIEDTEPFVRLVQSALQRRKSRAGMALENHLAQILTDQGLQFTRTGVTENRLKPDFILPGIGHYHDANFPNDRLTMLASKSTCKDRWRQILNEAARIPLKHLLTLEPGISEHQTREMAAEQVQLVVPAALHQTYTTAQQSWLNNLKDFVAMVRERQNR